VQPSEGAAAAVVDRDGRLLLVRENYDRRRYTFPGGAVEPGESPLDAVVRETLEETGVEVEVESVVGLYRLVSGLTVTLFRCSIVDGVPACPESGEIADLGWFDPEAIPHPISNILHHALADVVSDRRGVVRGGLPRIN
jgi:8-oxo-dGTP diphosphatase